jgi:hypothetical protein
MFFGGTGNPEGGASRSRGPQICWARELPRSCAREKRERRGNCGSDAISEWRSGVTRVRTPGTISGLAVLVRAQSKTERAHSASAPCGLQWLSSASIPLCRTVAPRVRRPKDSCEYERASSNWWVRVPLNSLLRLDRAERQKTSSAGRLVSCAIFGKQTSEQSGTQLPKIESFPQQRKPFAVTRELSNKTGRIHMVCRSPTMSAAGISLKRPFHRQGCCVSLSCREGRPVPRSCRATGQH